MTNFFPRSTVEGMKDVILIPTYNEKENVRELIPKIFALVPEAHITVIDDNSPDGTAAQVRRLMREYPALSIIERPKKEGLGAAYKDALGRVIRDPEVFSVTTMDADGSHDPSYVPLLLEGAREYDLVIGSRYISGGGVENWEPWRMYLSRFGNLYSRFFTGLPVRDLTAGFVCIQKELLEKIDFTRFGSSGYAYQIEFKFHCIHSLGAKWKETPIIFKNRREGESKMSRHIIREGLKTPIRLFFERFARTKYAMCHICKNTKARLWDTKNGHDLYRCPACGVVFVSPIPQDVAAIYGKEYFKKSDKTGSFGYTDYDGDKEPMRGIFSKYLQTFENAAAEKNILDVGAATGYFLDRAKERGWKTAGTEISKFAADEARMRGHDVRQGELPALGPDAFGQKFSVITMWDVLEHVASPREYIFAANRFLLPGGYLAINTPDAGSVWAKVMGKRWHLLVPPEHLHYFSSKNLSMMLEEAGFRVKEERKMGKKFSLAYIFGTLHRWQGFSAWGKASEFFDTPFWRNFGIPINLRDNIFIIAEKAEKIKKDG